MWNGEVVWKVTGDINTRIINSPLHHQHTVLVQDSPEGKSPSFRPVCVMPWLPPPPPGCKGTHIGVDVALVLREGDVAPQRDKAKRVLHLSTLHRQSMVKCGAGSMFRSMAKPMASPMLYGQCTAVKTRMPSANAL